MKKLSLFVLMIAAAVTLSGWLTASRSSSAATLPPLSITPTPLPTPPPINREDEIIKIETELVNLNVRVIDRSNRPINGLEQKDFQIFEDNVPQQIDFFSKGEVPTNYSLVIDNSGSLRLLLEQVIEAGKILVATNRPDDETSIIRFVSRDKIRVEQDFTSNKEELNYALDNLYVEGGQTAIIDAVYLAADSVNEYDKKASDSDRTRRALILVTDGEDRDSFYNEAQLFELLRETNVQIYTIGFVSELSKKGGLIAKSPQEKAKNFLQRLATETGGRAFFPESAAELTSIAKEISGDLRIQYSIGYIPSNDRKDGTYRNIRVNVADGPKKEKRIAITRTGRTAQ